MNKNPHSLHRYFCKRSILQSLSVYPLLTSLMLATTLFSFSNAANAQFASKDEVRQQAEKMCLAWAEEDEIAADEQQQFVDECIADFMLDNEENQGDS